MMTQTLISPLLGNFNAIRLEIAMKRRQLTGKQLSVKSDITPATVSRLLKDHHQPEIETAQAIADALHYPLEFFFQDSVEVISRENVSFRSLARMKAAERDSAIAAGSIGLIVSDWVDRTFNLPAANVPDLRELSPANAAKALRDQWCLGEKPVKSMIRLLEHNGVRVFSLAENTVNVDAFSFWHGHRPYTFLNNIKTAEHSNFDMAHELGHLVLHQHAKVNESKESEREANEFAAELLMPKTDVLAKAPRFVTSETIIKSKGRWKVSALALAGRLKSVGRLTDWQYRSICIDLTKRGYRKSEPIGIERESSVIWTKVFQQLWASKITKESIASELHIPLAELDSIVFGLERPSHLLVGGMGIKLLGGDQYQRS